MPVRYFERGTRMTRNKRELFPVDGKFYNKAGELVEYHEGRWRVVVNANRSGWWRYHEHYNRSGYCDDPARGY